MKRVLFLTNYASPYRVHFYDELAKSMDVTVLFTDRVEDQKNRSADWFVSCLLYTSNGEAAGDHCQLGH